MIVTCEKCGRVYDDAERWTICPHRGLGYPAAFREPQTMSEDTRVQPCNEHEASIQYVPGLEREPGNDNPGGFVRPEQTHVIPTVCRMVMYRPPDELLKMNARKGFQMWPAIVTHVWTPTCVNLHVQNDPDFPLPTKSLMVSRCDYADKPGEMPRTWSWSPRA